jgi:hypothetical protein
MQEHYMVVQQPCPNCGVAVNPSTKFCAACGTVLAIVNPSTNAIEKPVLKPFNQGFLDIRDPADFQGVRQPDFSFAHAYGVEKDRLPAIIDDLYTHVYEKLKAGAVGKITYRQTDYLDSRRRGQESPRRYIVVEQETNRGTKMSIFVRFLPLGDNLYVAVDSYILGKVNVFAIVLQAIITAIPLMIIFAYLSFLTYVSAISSQFTARSTSSSPGLGFFVCCLVPTIVVLSALWVNVLRAFRQHGDLGLALRQNFSHAPNDQSFNIDDILMFFKSVLPLVIFSVQDVFKKHGLSVKTLDEFATNVNNVVNISSGGGLLSVIGSAIGGSNNTVVK